MDSLQELKLYFQQEADKLNVDVEALVHLKGQLVSLIEAIDNLVVNEECSLLADIFASLNFNMTYDNFVGAVSLIVDLNQLDSRDVPQYQTAWRDLANLKDEINNHIREIEDKIKVSDQAKSKVDIYKKYEQCLEDDGLTRLLSNDELEELFTLIKHSSMKPAVKAELIYIITNVNIAKKQKQSVENAVNNPLKRDEVIAPCIDENIQTVNEILDKASDTEELVDLDSQAEERQEADDQLLARILEIIDHLSKYYEIMPMDGDSAFDISTRKDAYFSLSTFSKYQWPLIYTDLCNVLVPKYRNNQKREEITELFRFIVGIYENYESTIKEFDDVTIRKIESYINKLNGINLDNIIKWSNIIKSYTSEGLECDDLGSILHISIPFSNDQILLFEKIIRLKNEYNEYINYRHSERGYRFDTCLDTTLELIAGSKEEINSLLLEINELEQTIATSKSVVIEPSSELAKDIDIKDDKVHSLAEKDLANLVIFMNGEGVNGTLDKILAEGINVTTLRNIVNCLYDKHYNCSNYRGISKNKYTGYRKLWDIDNNRSLEKNQMYRSRKGDVRCPYREIHVSERNRQIMQELYPNFNGSLFLVIGIFYKDSDETTYVDVTNSYLNNHQKEVDGIIELFKNDFEKTEDIEKALSLIEQSLQKYNDACSTVVELTKKKVGDK